MTNKIYSVQEIQDKVVPVAKSYGVDALYLFGSYAKGVADVDSDIEFRVDKGAVRGFRFASLYADLEESLNKPIDLVTSSSLDEKFRQGIADEEVLLYAKQG